MGDEAPIQDQVTVNSVRFTRPGEAPDGDRSSVIGGISGCLSWSAWLADSTQNSRTVGSFAEVITAAVEICATIPTGPETRIEAAIIITSCWLEPRWRGNHLSRRIFDQLIDLLLLTPESTLVITYLEPQPNPVSTHTTDGHHAGTYALEDACREAGFEQWRHSNAWWIRPSNPTWQP